VVQTRGALARVWQYRVMDTDDTADETAHRLREHVVSLLRAGVSAQRDEGANDALLASVEEFLTVTKDPRIAMLFLAKGAGEVLDALSAHQGLDAEGYLQSLELKLFGDRYLSE
jgi:hypothetical protein